jgi:hypothetical protein
MAILPKAIPIKISMTYITEIEKSTLEDFKMAARGRKQKVCILK